MRSTTRLVHDLPASPVSRSIGGSLANFLVWSCQAGEGRFEVHGNFRYSLFTQLARQVYVGWGARWVMHILQSRGESGL